MTSLNFGIAIFPLSWHLGLWSRPKKSIFAVGPIRLIWYKTPGGWKPHHLDGVSIEECFARGENPVGPSRL